MRTFRGKMALLLGIVGLCAFGACVWLVAMEVQTAIKDRTVSTLRTASEMAFLAMRDSDMSIREMQQYAEDVYVGAGVRITVIDASGEVTADSMVGAQSLHGMDNHMDRPEITSAISGGAGTDIRSSGTTRTSFMYFAKRYDFGDGAVIIRTALPLKGLKMVISHTRSRVMAFTLLIFVLSMAAGFYILRTVTRPLSSLVRAASDAQQGLEASYPLRGGDEIRRLSSTIRDMSSALGATSKALEEERLLLGSVVQNLPLEVILVNKDMKVLCWNNAVPWLLHSGDISGLPLQGAVRDSRIADLAERTAASGKAEVEKISIISGQKHHVSAQAIPLGQNIMVAAQNITEAHGLEELRKNFVADVSHQLQTPLTVIRAAAELAASICDSTVKPYLNRISEQQERMSVLVDRMLTLSMLESSAPSEPNVQFDLCGMLKECGDEARAIAEGVEIEMCMPKRAPYTGRKGELRMGVQNLVDNAIKYTAMKWKGSAGGKVSVLLEADDKSYTITVRDNGVGISPDMQARIFRRFQRGTEHGGHGLGLSIAKHIVEGHGGNISIKSDKDTIFVIYIPLNRTNS